MQSNINKRKHLPCPVCGFKRLIDADEYNVSELKPEQEIEANWRADYFQKCPRCKQQIGIKKVS